jgi:hypothetical protein
MFGGNMTKTEDKHNASKSGARSEKEMRAFIESLGITFLKTQKDFIEYYGSKDEGIKIWRQTRCRPLPIKYHHLRNAKTKLGKLRRYETDGYIPELNMIVEMKYSKGQGTTEEKIHKDLIKIKDGVYQNELGSTLLYIIFGPNSGKAFDFEMFEYDFNEAKRNGDPHCGNTTVIIDDTPTLEHLRAFFGAMRMAAK